MNNLDRSKTIIRREFSWDEWIARCADNQHKISEDMQRGNEWQFQNVGGLKGGRFSDIATTLEVASNEGWTAAIPDAETLIGKIESDIGEAMFVKRVSVFDVAGSEVDMGRFMSGQPECMREYAPRRVMRTGRVIKIAVPICYPSTIHADTVKARGSAVMALVNAFAMHQHPVEIHAVLAIHGNGDQRRNYNGEKLDGKTPRLAYSIRVQEADQTLHMGRVMYALAHPTMLRQIGFAAEHGENEDIRSCFGIGASYGFASYAADIEDLNINVENAIILPPLMGNNGWSEAESVAWIKSQLEMLGQD